MSDLSGRQLGKYELREIIRRGGMSAVYEAYQPSLHRLVAVKVLAFPGDPEFAARFEREARSIAALQHPNVVRVYDYGEQDGQAYLVMQYVEGGVTLVDLLREPQAPVRCLELMEHVLAGLGYAHGQGIVHRDVKPSNVLMASPTWPMLADFGIAKLLAVRGQQLTATGVVAGTPTYMAPEQAFRLSVDTRTDLYSAGVMLYEMVTGRVPFDAGTPVATLMLHAYEPPPPPRELNPALPEELEAMVLKALAKDPADRFQSAEEMGEAIQSLRTVLERPSSRALAPPDPLASAYTSGVRAFSQGRFDQAIRQLEPVAAADPAYEDVQTLLDAARAAHQAQRYTPPVIPSATPGPGTPPRIIPPLGYPPVGAPAPADPTQPTPPPAPGYSPPRAMPPGYPPQDAPVPEPPAAAGSPAPAWPPAGPAGAGSGQPPEQPPPRRGRRGSGGGWFEERRRVAVVVVAVVALLGGSIWGAGLFGANQAQAREIILQARGEAGPNAFTQPVTPTKPKRFGTGAIGTGTNAKQGVLQLHGDQVGLYGGTQNQSTCNRAQMITYLRQSPAKAQAWVAALNSDPTLAWSGGTKLTVAQIPDYINELTPVLLRLDTRVTNNGYRDGHPTPFQAVLQAGTAVLIDKLGVPRSRCACGNPLLEPKDLTKTSQYSGAAWPGFKATTIVTVAPAPKQVTNVMLVDVDKGTNAVFNRTTGTAGGSDVTVKLTNKIKTEINLNLILQTAQVIAPPPSTEAPVSSTTAAGVTDTSGGSSSETTASESGSTEPTTSSGSETSTSGTETTSSSSETTSSQTTTSNTETTTSNDTTTTLGGSTSSNVTTTSVGIATTTEPPPSTATSEATTSSPSSTATSANTSGAVAVVPAVYRKAVNAQLPSQHGYQVAFWRTSGRWRQGWTWTRTESPHERPDRSPAGSV